VFYSIVFSGSGPGVAVGLSQGRSFGVAAILGGWYSLEMGPLCPSAEVLVRMGWFQSCEIVARVVVEGPLCIAIGSGNTLPSVYTVADHALPLTRDPVAALVCPQCAFPFSA
jgi:hypothetical protein